MKHSENRFFLFLTASVFISTLTATADIWPAYRHDAKRSGVSSEQFSPPLSLKWVFTPTAPPEHAWGDPQPKPIEGNLELPRLRFDDAYHVTAGYGLVFFGSSADNKIYALDAETGSIRWEFFTDGPVRTSPTLWKHKLYAGSDDGYVYCLNAKTGSEIWRFQAAPSDDFIIGNGRMISVWPVRTGIVIDKGVACFGSGVFPAEGVYLFAVNAENGNLIWKNNSFGKGGSGDVSPQGYIVASDEKLFVPSGRTMPAAFSRKTGKFLFHRNFSWRGIGLFGGTYSLLSGDILFNGTEQMLGVSEKTGSLVFTMDIRKMAASEKHVFILTGEKIAGYHRNTWIRCNRELYNLQKQIVSQTNWVNTLKKRVKTNKKLNKQLRNETEKLNSLNNKKRSLLAQLVDKCIFSATCRHTDSLIATGGMVFAGGDGSVAGFSTETGKKVFTGRVQGKARGLAASEGKLFASTDQGDIHCFIQGKPEKEALRTSPEIIKNPFKKETKKEEFVDVLVKNSGIKKGYCLLLSEADTESLAFFLSRKTDLMIYAVVSDEDKAEAAKKVLSKAGVYGSRVIVVNKPADKLHFSDYFANLIICHSSFLSGPGAVTPDELFRYLKPCGGTAYIGSVEADPDLSQALSLWHKSLKKTIALSGDNKTEIIKNRKALKIMRGPVPGSGSWTHQYADPGNTTCSSDTAVKGPLGILWYGDPGPAQMPNRHASNVAPLAFGGRMFVEGENVIMAYDSFNGVKVWEKKIPGAMRTNLKRDSGNLASDGTSLFAAIGKMCVKFDAASGKILKTYLMPDKTRSSRTEWGYISIDNGTVFGSSSHGGTDCEYVFALDAETGKHLWTFKGKHIMHTTICAGDGTLFFVDRYSTDAETKRGIADIKPEKRLDRNGRPVKPDVRMVYALNTSTGKIQWKRPQYVSDCVKISSGGGDLTAMYKNGILLLCGQPWNGHFWSEFFSGAFSRRSLIAISANDGSLVWSGRKGYRSRPLIVGDTIIAEPWAHDLATGKETMRINPVTGEKDLWQMARPGHHCGCIAASPNVLFFRSRVAAYYDLQDDCGTVHFGAQRSGCWINCIPANGVVLMPEASSGCVCPFSLHCTTVFKPGNVKKSWGMYSAPGALTPVEHLAVNFGAPGDRKDKNGTLWLAYPRPYTGRLVLPLKLLTQLKPGGGFVSESSRFLSIPESPCPWVYASSVRGLAECSIPVTKPDDAPGVFTVRLHFKKFPAGQGGGRIAAVKLGGKEVAKNLDLTQKTEDGNKALVKVFRDITIHGMLDVELVSKDRNASGETAHFLNGIEIIRTETLPVSIKSEEILLNSFQRSDTQTLKLRNHSENKITGHIKAGCPDGFLATVVNKKISIAAGGIKKVVLETKLKDQNKPGRYKLLLQFVSAGKCLSENTVRIRYTGERGEIIVTPSMDAHVHKRTPDKCFSDTPFLYIDGGSSEMEDTDHAISFLTFPISIPGKPLSAELHLQASTKPYSESNDSGVIRLVKEPWSEKTLSYNNQPEIGRKIGTIGAIQKAKAYTYTLNVNLEGKKELRVALFPTSTDGSHFDSQEENTPPELFITYGPEDKKKK